MMFCVGSAWASDQTDMPIQRLESLVYPVSYPRVSGNFGKRFHPIHKVTRHHGGIDLAAPEGSIVRAVTAGKVVFADSYGGYGKLVVLQHEKGITTHYGHLFSIEAKLGSFVRAGARIGSVGSTGNSTGPHLHFEVREDGEALDPKAYLPDFGTEPRG
jgi:murein DD-endopeptidase MepM/ murein hydrolase activator NlpD